MLVGARRRTRRVASEPASSAGFLRRPGIVARLATPVVVLAGLGAGAPPVAHAAEYYVNSSSDSCSISGPGSPARPYCTIQSALNAHHAAGTIIHVLPGIYREQVTMNWSGTAVAPITVQAQPAPGAPVVVDGSEDLSDPAQWTPSSGNVWIAKTVSWNVIQVFADSVRLVPSTADTLALPAGTYRYVQGRLFVNMGGDNPGTHELYVGHRPYGFYISNKAWVTVDGFTVRYCEDRGIQLTNGANNIELTDNDVAWSGRFGVQLESSANVHFARNRVWNNADHGISVTAGTNGCLIEKNESFGNFSPPGFPSSRKADGIYFFAATGNTLLRNHFHDNQSSGVDFQRGASNNVSVQNCSWTNGLTGFNHLTAKGNVHNCDVAFGNNWDGIAADDSSTGMILYNCISSINGLVHSRYNIEVDSTSTDGFTSDDNIVWNPSGEHPFRYSNTTYERLSEYQAVSGQDSRTIQRDPLWVDPNSGDFHLQPASPAIDVGNSGTPNWPETDADGNDRRDIAAVPNGGQGPVTDSDRGAFEFIGVEPTPGSVDTVPRLDHIIVIIMENKAYDHVRFAPYTAGLIASSSAMAHSYAYQHQSQSDYYAMWGAIGRGVTESICPAVGSPYITENLGHLCEQHGRTWRAYSEDLPAAGDSVCQKKNYVRRHCPWTDWGNLNHANERPYGDLAGDMLAGTLPDLAFVVPDLCHDTHNYCGVDTIQIGDDWLSANMPAMIQAVGPRGVVILTWDEDDGSDGNHILTVFSGAIAKKGYLSQRYINFFVMVRTITDALGLPAFAEAANASPVTDVWVKGIEPGQPPPPPVKTVLAPVKPNPFRGSMTTSIDLAATTQVVHADVYDTNGRRIRTLLQGPFSGMVSITWDGTDDHGRRVASGLYLLKVRSPSGEHEAKLLLLK